MKFGKYVKSLFTDWRFYLAIFLLSTWINSTEYYIAEDNVYTPFFYIEGFIVSIIFYPILFTILFSIVFGIKKLFTRKNHVQETST